MTETTDGLLQIINSKVSQKQRGGVKSMTPLSQEDIDNICIDIANSVRVDLIVKKYHIGYRRLTKIQILYRSQIDKLALEYELSRDKRILSLANRQRENILTNISEKDIKKAKLQQKTSAIVDLTNVKRLESGQSTVNLGVNVTDMTREQIEKFIKSTPEDVNTTDTPSEIIDLNATEQIKEQTDAL